MNSIQVGDRVIGEGHPCYIIAEAGANFRIGDDPEINYKQAMKLIDLAIEARADAVKFQLYRADSLYVSKAGYADYIGKKKPIWDIIHEMELPYEWLSSIKERCDRGGITFLCTPFDEVSTDELEGVGIEAYKIASYTITHIPLLKYIASKGKPIIMSTGASTEDDIKRALEAIRGVGNEHIALMQCTAKYPAPLSTVNLRVISSLMEHYNVPVGLSDHSREPYIAPMGAVALGASIIEKHYTTDNSLPGPDHGFAILDTELVELVNNIRLLEEALGSGVKYVQKAERELHHFCRRRIYTTGPIKKGELLTPENISVLRSGKLGKGLEPENYEKLLGKRAIRDMDIDHPVSWEDTE